MGEAIEQEQGSSEVGGPKLGARLLQQGVETPAPGSQSRQGRSVSFLFLSARDDFLSGLGSLQGGGSEVFVDATDAQLCKDAAQGNQEAFAELVGRYQGAVCAVTFAATGRADLSEDLAQETFLIAWKKLHGIEQPERVGGWSTGIARNLARKSFRERPVVPLEEAAGIRDDARGLEEKAVEQEMHAHLWELLRGLSPRYREVMVLYYREQLDTPTLAAQLGISVSAAQQRLSRGRRMIREELERSLADELRRSRPGDAFGRRVAAALPVLPLAAPPAASTATTALSSLTGVLVMHKAIYVVVAAVAVLLFEYALRDKPKDDAPSIETPTAAQPRAFADAPERRAPVQSTQASGQVLGANGQRPLPGAIVTFVTEGGSLATIHTPGSSAQLAVAVADDEGAWTLPGLEPGRYRATATAPGHLPAQLRGLRVSSAQELRDVRFELVAGGLPVSGVVSDIGGGPVAGATVHAKASIGLPVAALTDEDGRYKLQLPPGRHELSVWDLDYQEASAWIDVRGQGSGVDFQLMPAATLSGQVIARASGEPVAGASVSFQRRESFGGGFRSTRASDDERVLTDEDGRFTLQRLSPATYNVHASANHLATAAEVEVAIGLADQTEGVVVALDPAFNISGRVVQADGSQGVAGAQISTLGGPNAAVLSGPDGEFALLGVLPGAYPLSVEAEGFLHSVMDDSVTIKDGDVEGLTLEVDSGVSVQGQLDPPQPAEVKLALTQSTGGFGVLLQGQRIRAAHGLADDEGRFDLSTVPVGTWLVVAEAADGSRGQAEITVAESGLQDVRIPMEPRPSLGGTVTHTDGTPLSQATVHLFAADVDTSFPIASRRTTTTDTQGGFDFVGVDAGAYVIKLLTRERLPLSADDGSESFAVEVGETSVDDLRLQVAQASGVLGGVAVDASGEPLVDASIRLASESEGARMFEAPLKLTDAEGHFEFEGLPPGTYSAYARSNRGDARGETTDIEVTEGTSTVEIRTQALASIRGTVTSEGAAVRQFEVSMRGPGKRTFVDDQGRFILDRIDASGPAVVVVTTDTGSATQRVEVTPGETTEATFKVGTWGTVTGRALWPDGTPAAGLKASASSRGGTRKSENWLVDDLTGAEGLVTDSDGRFTAEGIGAGRAEVSFMKSVESAATSRMMIGRATWLGHVNTFVESGETVDLGDIELLDAHAPADPGTLGLRLQSSFDRPAYPDEDGYAPPIGAPDQDARLWIASVSSKGPAAGAGVTVGLEVVSLDGKPITNPGRTIVQLAQVEAGRVVALGVRNEGEEPRVVSVTAKAE